MLVRVEQSKISVALESGLTQALLHDSLSKKTYLTATECHKHSNIDIVLIVGLDKAFVKH